MTSFPLLQHGTRTPDKTILVVSNVSGCNHASRDLTNRGRVQRSKVACMREVAFSAGQLSTLAMYIVRDVYYSRL